MTARARVFVSAPLRVGSAAPSDRDGVLATLVALGVSASAAALGPPTSAPLSGGMPHFESKTFGSVLSVVARGDLFDPQPLQLPGGAHSFKGAIFAPVPKVFGFTYHLTAAGPFASVGPKPQTPILPAQH